MRNKAGLVLAMLWLAVAAGCSDDPSAPPGDQIPSNNGSPNNGTVNNGANNGANNGDTNNGVNNGANNGDTNNGDADMGGNNGAQDMGDAGDPGDMGGNNGEADMADADSPDGGGNNGEPDMEDPGPYCEEGAVEDCEDGIDNNCNGLVDEGCTCLVAEKPCYTMDPAHLEAPNTACRAGVQTCDGAGEFYDVCTGEVLPSEEVCDGQDNDCDGLVDELADCNNQPPEVFCPEDRIGPPLAFYTFVGDAADPDGDAIVRTTWRILDKPVGSTARPNPSNNLTTEIFADTQGIYILELEAEDERGAVGRCTTRLETNSEDQLRIELVWNVGASDRDRSDLDLHLLKSPQSQWFDDQNSNNEQNNGGDCYWRNCRICTEGYSQGAEVYEQRCRRQIAAINEDPNRSPQPRLNWFLPLDDNDPRLDLDDIEGSGPENINIRRPLNGTYRLGVHYWSDEGFGNSTATLRVYCLNELVTELEPVVLRATEGDDGGDQTEFWEVGDIVWSNEGCQVTPFGSPNCRRICTKQQAENGGCPEGQSRGVACP